MGTQQPPHQPHPLTTAESSHLPILETFIQKNPSIKYIRYQWIDYTGILRLRVIPVAQAHRLAVHSSPFAMSPIAMTSTTINEFMPGLIPTGIDLIYPDYTSLRPCLYAPG